jgi:hypothetical protein
VGDTILSRAGKPLYNIPKLHLVCEVFLGSWEATVSAVRTQEFTPIDPNHLYSLDPIDSRLLIGKWDTLSSQDVAKMMYEAVNKGYEGLVIESNKLLYKVKPVETFDVKVDAVIAGKGRLNGKMGALVTSMGNVGTGFTDEQRDLDYLDKIIEVEAMSLTPSGKFRHPRFIRIREDK